MTNIEELVADSALNEPKEIVVGGVKMKINKPKVSTLIAASKYIGKFPQIPIPKTKGEEFEIAIASAGECGDLIGYIVAVLILGRKNMFTEKKIFGFTYKKVDNITPLAEAILDEYDNKELKELISELLSENKTNFFLDIIISLSKANLLRPTKIQTEATVSGH